jgi:hypothetical protein
MLTMFLHRIKVRYHPVMKPPSQQLLVCAWERAQRSHVLGNDEAATRSQ